MENIQLIKDQSILFLKRDHGFDLSEQEFNLVIRTLEREQRIRNKPKVDALVSDTNQVELPTYNRQSASNYESIVE